MPQPSPLEVPPPADQRPSERRWAILTLGAMAIITIMAVVAIRSLSKAKPAQPAAPADHGPLPKELRVDVLNLLEPHLDHAELVIIEDRGLREFHIKGRPKAALAKEFNATFRPFVVNDLMPKLRPYGEIISFEIESLDYPPARLRPLPEHP